VPYPPFPASDKWEPDLRSYSTAGMRRVTQPPFIAGPLANIIIVSGEKYQKGKLVHYKQIGNDFKTHFTYEKIS
jgi:hypothetical protein